jgi:hypothetical protein
MSDGFPDLLENFNNAATSAAADTLPLPLLLVHYQTALRHGTTDPEEKRRLSATLFDMAYKTLDSLATPEMARTLKDTDPKHKFSPLLDALCAEECIMFMPGDAAHRLASLALKASATGAAVTFDHFRIWDDLELYQKNLTQLAALSLHYADEICKPRAIGAVETSKDIAPVKRITLKPAEGGQP